MREKIAIWLSGISGTSLGSDLAFVVRHGHGRYMTERRGWGMPFYSWQLAAERCGL